MCVCKGGRRDGGGLGENTWGLIFFFFRHHPPTFFPTSYYKSYGPKRADYVTALVANNMNWTRVDENLKAARKGDTEAASGV